MTYEEYKKAQQKGVEAYQQAQKHGLTQLNRWEDGIDHHPKTIELIHFLMEHDFKDYDDYFCWKFGGDGDNGESLAFQMDAYFEEMDIQENESGT